MENDDALLLRIAEWNINRLGKKNLSKCIRLCQCIETLNPKPDIVVLTECGPSFDVEIFKNEFIDSDFQLSYSSKEDNCNHISILINNAKIESLNLVEFQNFCNGNDEKIHPDRICVDIKLKNNKNICVLGVRLLTSWYNKTCKDKSDQEKYNKKIKCNRIAQNAQFVYDIEQLQPDIIIGDLNTSTEMEKTHIYDFKKWKNLVTNTAIEDAWRKKFDKRNFSNCTSALDAFCELIQNQLTYKYWPQKADNVSSIKAKNAKNGLSSSSPDTFLWNIKKISSCECFYFPDLTESNSKPSEVITDWPSDHCMLVADIKV